MERLGVFIHSGSTQLQKWMPSWVVDVGTSHRSADLEKLGNWIGEDLETAGLEPLSFEPTSSGLRFHGSGQSLRFVKQRWKDVWSQRVLDLNQLALAEAEISEFATVEEVIGNLIQQRFALLKGLPTSSREPANAGMRAQAAEHGKTRETLANLLREIHQKIRTQKSPSEQAAIDRVYKEQQRVTESQLKKLSQQMLNPAQRNDDQFLVWATLESRQLEAKAWFEAQTH
jgi:formate dehydrogenase maturation protein FdhE